MSINQCEKRVHHINHLFIIFIIHSSYPSFTHHIHHTQIISIIYSSYPSCIHHTYIISIILHMIIYICIYIYIYVCVCVCVNINICLFIYWNILFVSWIMNSLESSSTCKLTTDDHDRCESKFAWVGHIIPS